MLAPKKDLINISGSNKALLSNIGFLAYSVFHRLFLKQDISLGIRNYCFLLTGEVFLVCYQNASKNLVTNKVTLILFFHKAPKEALAQCVLAEIPQQVVGYFNTYKLLPPKNPAKK